MVDEFASAGVRASRLGAAVGEALADRLAGMARQAGAWGHDAARSLLDSCAEFVAEESKMVVGAASMRAQEADILALADEVAALSVRIGRLRKHDSGA